MKKVPAWVILCVIALVAGAALGTTNALTKGPIAEQAARAAEAARAAVLPAAERFEQVEVAEGAPVDNCYQGVDASGNAVGYVAQVTVTGFGGPIEVTVGVNAEGELTGIQCGGSGFSETAGLGAKVKETRFFQPVCRPCNTGCACEEWRRGGFRNGGFHQLRCSMQCGEHRSGLYRRACIIPSGNNAK